MCEENWGLDSGGLYCGKLTNFAGPVDALGQMPDGTLIHAYRLQKSSKQASNVLHNVWLTNYGARLVSWMGLPKIQIVNDFNYPS